MVPVNITVKVLIFNSEGKFLTIKRNYTNQKWDLPGGAVELPETIEQAIVREVKEETGLDMGSPKIIEVQSVFGDDGNYLIFLAFRCEISTSREVVLSHEHSEFKWVSKNEFLDLDASNYLKEIAGKI